MNWVDWTVVITSCVLVFVVGMWFSRRAASKGLEGYFAGDRDLPWWSIALSNTATYQSGNGVFVTLILVHGLAGNWSWWAGWVIWMPLAAVIWSRIWQRSGVVSVAELLTVRYGGPAALPARKVFAAWNCIAATVVVISYITGVFALTIQPVVQMSTFQILLAFGVITVIYTMFGGLLGVVYTDVTQCAIMFLASTAFFLLAIPHFGGWHEITSRITEARPNALNPLPPTPSLDLITFAILVFQGFFSTADGGNAQKFIAARSERHAVAGQLLNSFLALSVRVLPLIGLGVIGMSMFWTADKEAQLAATPPAGFEMLSNSAFVWGELIKKTAVVLPVGMIGLLIASEAAAYMSTLSAQINYGSSLVVNDLLPKKHLTAKQMVQISRLVVLMLFVLSGVVAIYFVDNVISWFMFINAAIGTFGIVVGVMRFCWWRFNAWADLTATILSAPLAAIFWFGLGYKDAPYWQSALILMTSGTITLTLVALLTPPEPMQTLQEFYLRCRPPGFWGPVVRSIRALQAEPAFVVPMLTEIAPDYEMPGDVRAASERKAAIARMAVHFNQSPGSGSRLFIDCVLGIAACVSMVIATAALFSAGWTMFIVSLVVCVVTSTLTILRVMSPTQTLNAARATVVAK